MGESFQSVKNAASIAAVRSTRAKSRVMRIVSIVKINAILPRAEGYATSDALPSVI
jgi:hypothetical protein